MYDNYSPSGSESSLGAKILGVFVLVMLAVGLLLVMMSATIIDTGEKGVVLRWGAMKGEILDQGFHWVNPISESVKKINVQTQKLEAETIGYSKDIQTVTVALALNYHIRPEMVGTMYQEVGVDFQKRIIDPAMQESVKSATAKFTAQELVEQRPFVKDEITGELVKRLSNYFSVDNFAITNFDFSDAYEEAIEKKQVAQQKAFEQENITKQEEEKGKQRVIAATAEAQAIKIQAEAITQQGGADYVKLKAIEKWNGTVPQSMIPGSAVPFIDLNK